MFIVYKEGQAGEGMREIDGERGERGGEEVKREMERGGG